MLQVRCPYCDCRLRVPERDAGKVVACSGCGKPLTVPSLASEPDRGLPAWVPQELRGRAEDKLEPWRPYPPEPPPRVGPWRFVSPSALALALLTLPFPWLEVSCQPVGSPTPNFHYTQTGAQMLLGRATQVAATAAPTAASVSDDHPARVVMIWLWLVAVLSAVGAGMASRQFLPALLSLILSSFSLGILLLLMVVVAVEEVFNNVQFTAWPVAALVACCVAVGGSITTLVLRRRKPPRRDPDDEL